MGKTKILRSLLVFVGSFIFLFLSSIFIFDFLNSKDVFYLSIQMSLREWMYPTAFFLVFYSGILFLLWRRSRKYFYPVLLSIILTLGAFVFIVSIMRPTGGVNHHNYQRRVDLNLLSTMLDIYHESNDTYPIVPSGCQGLSVLDQFLDVSLFNIQDPSKESSQPPYKYAVSDDGSQFILRATFSTRPYSGELLNKDLDGVILGCNCNDPNYCIGSES